MSELIMHEDRARSPTQINDTFDHLVKSLQHTAELRTIAAEGHVFVTERTTILDRNELYEAYLAGFPTAELRQEHTCSCCKDFLRTYGGLVTVDPATGKTQSLLWDEEKVPFEFAESVKHLRQIVEDATVDGVFYPDAKTSDAAWLHTFGTARRGGFSHFALTLSGLQRRRNSVKSAYENMAESRENFRLLFASALEFKHETVEKGVAAFVNHAQLSCYSQHVETVTWLNKLQIAMRAQQHPKWRRNLVWAQVARQNTGKLRVGQTVVGEFLHALQAGESLEAAIRTFLRMVDPKDYMRPKAAPTQANIDRGEEIVAKLGLTTALVRRNATLADVPASEYIWRPISANDDASVGEGVFSHLKAKDSTLQLRNEVINGGTMTWTKFAKKVLPLAEAIEFYVPHSKQNYGTLVTAVHADAKPILMYDREERRNPVSNYMYTGGSYSQTWGLVPYIWVKVQGILPPPTQWYRERTEPLDRYFLLLEDARDQNDADLALFPELIRRELHEVRATIEQFSNTGRRQISPKDIGGLFIGNGPAQLNLKLRVRAGKVVTEYLVDRFD